jgi:hypothetical protein
MNVNIHAAEANIFSFVTLTEYEDEIEHVLWPVSFISSRDTKRYAPEP